MKRTRFSEAAARDFEDIGDFLRPHSPAAADRVVTKLEARCAGLADASGQGRPCDDLIPGARTVPYLDYVIVYFPIPDGVLILRVVHGARDLNALFE